MRHQLKLARRPTCLVDQVLSKHVATHRQPVEEDRTAIRRRRDRGARSKRPYTINLCGLGKRCKRPRHRRSAQKRDELPPPHSITSSARTSNVAGTSRPRVFAVRRLITSSTFVGTRTGNSFGFAPL